MTIEHVVAQGECLSSIAAQHGLFWQTLWDANARLKEARGDPNRLAPGDVVTIPERQRHEEACPSEQRHRFRRKGTPAKLRIVIEEDGEPLADRDYVLRVDGTPRQGKTDGAGLLDEWINPSAQLAELDIAGLKYHLELGHQNPLDDAIGIQSRLQNLGFYSGALDGDFGPLTRAAISEFRARVSLPPGDTSDDAFLRELCAWSDEAHGPRYAAATSDDVPEVRDGADDHDLDANEGSAAADEDDDVEVDPETGSER